MINSLGVFEHPQSLGILHSAFTTLSTFFDSVKDKSKKEELQKSVAHLKS